MLTKYCGKKQVKKHSFFYHSTSVTILLFHSIFYNNKSILQQLKNKQKATPLKYHILQKENSHN